MIASLGASPRRIPSTIIALERFSRLSSPTPVEPAEPTSLSRNSPAPRIGESPTRPGIFHDRPEVVVVQPRSPWVSRTEQWIVPVTRRRERLADEGGHLLVGWRQPVVVGVAGLLPVQPDLPRLVGQQVDLGEAVRAGEPQRPLADQQAMPRALHHQPGDGRRVHDVADRGHRAAAVGRAVHDGGIELDHAVLVGQAAEADRVVLGIGLDDRHPLDRRVERVVPLS